VAVTQPIRNNEDIIALTNYYLNLKQYRNHVLIVLCINTALRISDILSLTWDDVYDFKRACFRNSIDIFEGKTKKSKIIALNQSVTDALEQLALEFLHSGNPIIMNKRTGFAISRVHAFRIVRSAGEFIGLPYHISPHSLRKTLGYHSWKNNVGELVLSELFNHSSTATTRRYLGITQDDLDAVLMGLDYSDSNVNKSKNKEVEKEITINLNCVLVMLL